MSVLVLSETAWSSFPCTYWPIWQESDCFCRGPSWLGFIGPAVFVLSSTCPAVSPWCGCQVARWWILFLQRRACPTRNAGSLCSSPGPRCESPGDSTCRPSQTECCWCTAQRTEEEPSESSLIPFHNFSAHLYQQSDSLWVWPEKRKVGQSPPKDSERDWMYMPAECVRSYCQARGGIDEIGPETVFLQDRADLLRSIYKLDKRWEIINQDLQPLWGNEPGFGTASPKG